MDTNDLTGWKCLKIQIYWTFVTILALWKNSVDIAYSIQTPQQHQSQCMCVCARERESEKEREREERERWGDRKRRLREREGKGASSRTDLAQFLCLSVQLSFVKKECCGHETNLH